MTIQRSSYASPVEALAALIRTLVVYEQRYQMSSADFYARYHKGTWGMRLTLSSGLGTISITCS